MLHNPASSETMQHYLPKAASSRIGELEVLRAVAILMVLVDHMPFNLVFWPWRFDHLIFGSGAWCGVDLFFAISGFVIARSLLPQLEGVTDFRKFVQISIVFWVRRAWRLWPSAWFWLAAPLLLCLIFNHSGAYYSFRGNWNMAVAGFTNLANFYMASLVTYDDKGTAFVQWSLSLEEQFYMLLPFAAFFLRRYLSLLLLALLVFSFFTPLGGYFMVIRSGSFAAGVLLAIASRKPIYADCAPKFLAKNRFARMGFLLGGTAFILSFGSLNLKIVPFFLGPVSVLTGVLVWAASYNQGYLWKPGFSRRVMEFIAARSYSLYLVHIPVYFGMHEAWYRMHKLQTPDHLQALFYFLITPFPLALLTELNYRLLERPLRERGKVVARQLAQRMQLYEA